MVVISPRATSTRMPPITRADRMPSPATVRRSRPADAAAISELVQHYVPPGTLLPRSPAFIAERAIDFLVATLGGRVVGCVHVEEYSPSLAEIRSLVVEPASQGLGIGVQLEIGRASCRGRGWVSVVGRVATREEEMD